MSTTLRVDNPSAAQEFPEALKADIGRYLVSKNLPPNNTWLSNFTTTVRPQTPLVALQKTALFRILATDLTLALDAASLSTQLLPTNIAGPEARERRLQGPITVQVLDIEDIGRSRWSQVEAIEAQERGETTKGREIVRVVAEESANPAALAESNATAAGGPHKLLLQDAAGTKVYGFELESVDGVGVKLGIGAKLVLRDLTVARGVVLLRPAGVEVLGGKVEVWDKKWRAERKEVLKRLAGAASENAP